MKANNHIHTLHEGQQNSYHYSMFNIKVIIGILEVSLFLLCWEMFLYGGVCPLLMFYEARKADTVLLQMRVLMTNMGLIIPVNLQKLNFFFFLVTLYFFLPEYKPQTSILQFWVHSRCNHYQKKCVFGRCKINLCTALRCWRQQEARSKTQIKNKQRVVVRLFNCYKKEMLCWSK